MRPFRALSSFCVISLLLCSLSFAVQPDRIAGNLNNGLTVSLHGNLHPAAKAEFDVGRANSNQPMENLSISFRPSPTQEADLDQLLRDQQNPKSPLYHKWLTPSQFGARFGLSANDLQKVKTWLASQGFTVTRVANSRNQVFFDGTVGQVETAFKTEIHNYAVNGEIHYANSSEPQIPAALSGIALAVQHLHNFEPKPRATVRHVLANPEFTSHVSGNHFLTPGDFATIYALQSLYSSGGVDGSGQKIAITGQSQIVLTDVSNFRSAAGLAANQPTTSVVPNTGSGATCSGDEGESDLDVEYSGGVAPNANIHLYYAGLGTGTSCGTRSAGAFDALQYIIDNNLAPIISNSYGDCEANIGLSFAQTMQGWVQQGNSQGQTVVSASGDSGAADCDYQVTSASQGLAVDLPAAIPEVTGAGGTEFNGDAAATVTGGDAGATTYWSGTNGGADTISSALSYIPEMGWNDSTADIAAGGVISASGGGASTFFTKPSWQTGTGVPNDGQRDVPDIAVSASADHDGYLFCSSDGAVTCTNGFRDANGNLAVVGGTSAAAPTISATLALINEYMGGSGFGNVNTMLYPTYASTPSAFNDVTTGDNRVPCTSGSVDCPSGTTTIGYSAGTGYDQVTGLGSINGWILAQAWASSTPRFILTPAVNSVAVSAGTTATVDIKVDAINGFNSPLTFTCTDPASESNCSVSPAGATTQSSVTLSITTTAATGKLRSPFDRGTGFLYAALLPGLFGIVFAGSRKRSRTLRWFGLFMLLGITSISFLGCGGSSTTRNPGTLKQAYTITVNATTGGSSPTTGSTTITLNVQ